MGMGLKELRLAKKLSKKEASNLTGWGTKKIDRHEKGIGKTADLEKYRDLLEGSKKVSAKVSTTPHKDNLQEYWNKGLIVPPRKFVLGELQGKGIYPDRLIAHKDGSFTVKESYYYRHGQSPEKIADKIKKAIPGIEIIDTEDEWRAWPKTSYFVVKFRIKSAREKPEKPRLGR